MVLPVKVKRCKYCRKAIREYNQSGICSRCRNAYRFEIEELKKSNGDVDDVVGGKKVGKKNGKTKLL